MNRNTRVRHSKDGLATVVGVTKDGKVVIALDVDGDGVLDVTVESKLTALATPAEVQAETNRLIAEAKAQLKDTKKAQWGWLRTSIVEALRSMRGAYGRATQYIANAKRAHGYQVESAVSAKNAAIKAYNAGKRF